MGKNAIAIQQSTDDSVWCHVVVVHGRTVCTARTTAAPNKPAQSEDASAREIVEFNRFLQGHQEVAVELHSKPLG